MGNRHPTGAASNFVTATLAIPSDAVRVIAAPPDTISQRNVEAATGVPPRAYLEAVRDPGFPLSVTRLGKLRIVNRVAFVEWLERGAFAVRMADGSAETAVPDEVPVNRNGPSDVLGVVGLRERRPNRQTRRKR